MALTVLLQMMSRCDIDWCVNYQRTKRGRDRSCMSPMQFGSHQSMRRVLSVDKRVFWVGEWREI